MNLSLRKSISSILFASSIATLTASAVASVGIQIPPPGPGEIPDYFGAVANYATSPAPAFAQVTATDSTGTGAVLAATNYDYNAGAYTQGVTSIQVVNGGTGYSANTLVTVSGGSGATSFTVTPRITNGVIVGIEEFTPTTVAGLPNPKYIANHVDSLGAPAPLTYLGTGFTMPINGTGIRKFVDALPGIDFGGGAGSSFSAAYNFGGKDSNGNNIIAGQNNLGQAIPLAKPDTTTFSGSDYYVIAVVDYTQKLHSDLPPTHLRGYVQIDPATGATMGKPQYLGPMIVAQKDRPVRVTLLNQLNTGDLGKLPIPVDVTYMGARGVTDTENRTAMHLHGGNTPWISDGTPRQTVKPVGEVNPNKGESVRNVPDMWFDASGILLPNSATCTQGTTTCTTPGATNDPGDGALTFYYTNQQSARLMFYHDHTEGLTRLNVYMGVAAPYLLQDQTEQDLVNGTNTSGNNPVFAKVLPPITDTIPVVIQEKTFVPNDKIPVINAFGAFKSQLNAQDSTWRWGSRAIDPVNGNIDTLNGTGDLWLPHVFSPNQNPGDVSGGNSVGRADYGPWFWPPFTGITHGAVKNPYFDPTCVSAKNGYCEGEFIPGTPNGNTYTAATLPKGYDPEFLNLGSPSMTPEAFNDTPLVNGTIYPYINVDPKPYRLKFLVAGNDRMFNLSLFVAASKNSSDTTAKGNAGAKNGAIMCDGTTAVDPADCTEVRMVPFDASQDAVSHFPVHTSADLMDEGWYTAQNGGITFDGRPSGVPDPQSRGPSMVQVGVDGGFLSTPVKIHNKPVNFEYNLKNIVVTNIKEHALLLGSAERADVVVDFTNFAGSTILLYNDSPAPVPAFDLRLDYYTGDADNTDTGGTFSTVPGYGPNTRTLMQIRVSNKGGTQTRPADDTGTIDMPKLSTAVQKAFKASQEPIILPQAAYDSVYGTNTVDTMGAQISRISDTSLTYTPLDAADPTNSSLAANPVTLEMQPKSIIEDWTMDYGRMNALLGTEMPKTSALTNTASPMAYIDPPTELVKISEEGAPITSTPITGTLPDGTQVWKITHNGVDSHPIHFHLFHVQLINRVGWDGAVRPAETNELGWKDIIRMNPLEDVIVALRPRTMNLPFKLSNSHRQLDPSGAADTTPNMFYNLNPVEGIMSNVSNQTVNYGWEYVWHCHILGHEENDMMRPIAVAQAPEAPSNITVSGPSNAIQLNWTDNSMTSNWVQIQRDTVSTFNSVDLVTFNVPYASECADQAGCARSYTDTTAPKNINKFYYRLVAQNTVGAGSGRQDGPRDPVTGVYAEYLPAELSALLPTPTTTTATTYPGTGGFDGYGNVTASSVAVNTVAEYKPTVALSANSLAFGNQAFASASAAQAITVTNSSTGNTAGYLSIANVSISDATNYTVTHNCTSIMAPATVAGRRTIPGGSCTINVVFNPIYNAATDSIVNSNPRPATLTITDNAGNVVGTTQTVGVTGAGVAAPGAALSLTTLDFGKGLVGKTTAVKTATLTNNGTGVLSISSVVATGPFTVASNNCGATLAVSASCTVDVNYTPTSASASTATLTFTDNATSVAGGKQVVTLKGTGVTASVPVLTAALNAIPVNYLPNVNLSWTASSTATDPAQVDTYTVQRSAAIAANGTCPATATAGNYPTTIAVTPSTAITTVDATVAANTTYCYLVNAVNVASATPFTSAAVKLTVPAAPAAATNLSSTFSAVNASGIGNVSLAWTASAGTPKATGYLVQYCANTALNCATNPTLWVSAGTATGTTYSITGLQVLNGTTANPFMFRVLAYNPVVAQSAVIGLSVGSVSPSWLSTVATFPAPNAPTKLTTVFSAQGTTLNLGWTPGATSATIPAATGYVVQQCSDVAANIATTCSSVSNAWTNARGILVGNSFNVQGLTPSTRYMFRVMATNPVASTPLTSGVLAFGLPNAPATLSANLVAGGQSINLAWPASVFSGQVPAPTSYNIEQCIGTATACLTGAWTPVATQSAGSTTTYTVTGLTAGTAYNYRVNGTNQFGVSSWTTVATALQYTAPAAPATVTASAATTSSSTLSYASATTGPTAASSYLIEQCVNPTATNTLVANCTTWTPAGIVATPSTTINGLQAGASYFFRVTAENGLNSTATNSGVLWTVPNAPGTPTVTAGSVTASSVGLSWTAPAGGVRSYTIERSTSNTFATVTQTTGITGTIATVTGLSANTTYYFRVVAVTPGGRATSSVVSQLTSTAAPTISRVTQGLNTDALVTAAVSWGNTGASSYNVTWSTSRAFTVGQSGVLMNVVSGTQNVIPVNTGTTVYFKVQAVYGTAPNTVTSAWSAVSNGVTAQ